MKNIASNHVRPALPAVVVGLFLVFLWAYARWRHAPDVEQGGLTIGVFVGWLGFMFLSATAAVVVWTATADERRPAGTASWRLPAYILISSLCGALLLL